MVTTRLLLTLILSTLSGASVAATFDGMDINGDGNISKAEFAQSGTFSDWDNDNDGRLDAGELAIPWAKIARWDLNGDDYIDEDEFYEGAWTAWNTDRNGHLDEGEYAEASKRWPL